MMMIKTHILVAMSYCSFFHLDQFSISKSKLLPFQVFLRVPIARMTRRRLFMSYFRIFYDLHMLWSLYDGKGCRAWCSLFFASPNVSTMGTQNNFFLLFFSESDRSCFRSFTHSSRFRWWLQVDLAAVAWTNRDGTKCGCGLCISRRIGSLNACEEVSKLPKFCWRLLPVSSAVLLQPIQSMNLSLVPRKTLLTTDMPPSARAPERKRNLTESEQAVGATRCWTL